MAGLFSTDNDWFIQRRQLAIQHRQWLVYSFNWATGRSRTETESKKPTMAMVANCIGIGCVEEQEDDFSMAMVTADSKLHAEERHVQEPTTAMVADCTGLGRVEEQEDDSSVATVIGDSRLHAEKRHVKEMQKEKQSELQKKIVGDAAGA